MKDYASIVYDLAGQFSGTEYALVVDEISKAYLDGDYVRLEENLTKLPTSFRLLSSLIDKVKDKPVYANLKKIFKGNARKEDVEIALSSLFTRCCIESKDFPEYGALKPFILKRLVEVSNL